MTYKMCERLITKRKEKLVGEAWEEFVDKMKNDMDIFLLAGRITGDEYNQLTAMLTV